MPTLPSLGRRGVALRNSGSQQGGIGFHRSQHRIGDGGRDEKEVSRAKLITCTCDRTGKDRNYGEVASRRTQARSVQSPVLNAEIVAIDQRFGSSKLHLWLNVLEVNRKHRFRNVQGARFAIQACAVPVEDTVSRIAILLDLDDDVSASDGVDSAAWNENAIPGASGQAVEQVGHRAVGQGALKIRATGPGSKPGKDVGVRGGRGDKPHFGFGFAAKLWCDLCRRVHLHGKPLLCIEQFDQQRKARAAPVITRTKDRLTVLCPEFIEGFSSENACVNHALRFLAVNQFPGLSHAHVRGKFLGENGFEFAAAPDSFHEQGLKNNGFGENHSDRL